jgi:quercetin dioxygenase-like cupin family protein
MHIVPSTQVAAEEVVEEGAHLVTIRWLISAKEGAPNFAMRLFELEPEGYTPYHNHSWEHEVFILNGAGEITTETGPRPVEQGDAILVLPDEKHQFRNTGSQPLRFICLIPVDG